MAARSGDDELELTVYMSDPHGKYKFDTGCTVAVSPSGH
jgi:hypothetical protein